jgi:hypothetical protein
VVRFPRQRVRHQARRRQRSSRHRRHRPRPMRRPINQEARKCTNLRTFSRRRFHHQMSSAAGSSRNCTNLPSFRMLHVCRIPMRVLSPPADSWKMCPAGNTYRGTRSGRRRSGLWVADELRHALRSCASSARGASVNCCSVRNDCGARSLQPTIGVGKLNAISWMRRTMGG